ncbi:PaaI family thioesterase [Halorarius litoreus]|uniref:PaaI family thioesterase n=1 Tax=Halorarius litoreus TaxID=2962676 RepID=UPI0020CF9B79|nr:PaaI family thioesterase [Halorarius litoreus]
MTEDDSERKYSDQYGENTGFNPEGENPLEQLRQHAHDHPLIRDMGITFESFDDGVLEASIPHNQEWANPGMGGALHGGMVVAYLDTVMGFTIMAAVADQPVTSGPTINLNTNFLSPAASDMVATGEIVRTGSSSAVVDGTLEDAETGEAIATAQGVWRVYADD